MRTIQIARILLRTKRLDRIEILGWTQTARGVATPNSKSGMTISGSV